MAQLLDLQVVMVDIGNAYLNAPCREKIWVQAGIEFGSEWKDKVLLITRALYGLKSSGAAWRSLLANTMRDIGYKSSYADSDVWMRPATMKGRDNRQIKYYEYCLIYVDDIICFSDKPSATMDELGKLYRFKETPAPPRKYLGAGFERFQLPDGRIIWSMNCDDYVLNAVRTVEDMLQRDSTNKRNRMGLNSRRCKTPWVTDYRPELDASDLLGPELTHRFQNLLGMARWAVELGRIDILHEVSKLSSYNTTPREGHL